LVRNLCRLSKNPYRDYYLDFYTYHAILIPKGLKMDTTLLGRTVRDARKKQHLTQEQLAALCGVGTRFLRELEHGKETCHVGKVLQVARALGLEIRISQRGQP